MNAYEYTVSLRVRHPSIDPAHITQVLGFQPWHCWRAGDPRRTPKGEPLEGTYRESYWTAQLVEAPRLSSEELPIEAFLLRTLAQLTRSHEFFARLQAEGGTAGFFIGVFGQDNLGLELSPALLLAIGRLGLAVSLELSPE